MNLGQIAGEICKAILPIPEETYAGNPKSGIAVCTLSSIELLKEIASSDMMEKIAIAGRLLSENKGIDSMIRHVIRNPNLHTIIVCGKEVSGHRTGHALFCLYQYGTDDSNRIINSVSPDPVLSVSKDEIIQFQNQVKLVNKIGQTNLAEIIQ